LSLGGFPALSKVSANSDVALLSSVISKIAISEANRFNDEIFPESREDSGPPKICAVVTRRAIDWPTQLGKTYNVRRTRVTG